MTPSEVKAWLGLPGHAPVKQEIISALADVEWPVTGEEQIETFGILLQHMTDLSVLDDE